MQQGVWNNNKEEGWKVEVSCSKCRSRSEVKD
jgi:hypothetical protein